MRVVLTIGQLDVGGTEGQLVQLARGLRDRGVFVAVASLYSGGPYVEHLESAGIPVYLARLPRIRGRDFLNVFILVPRLVRFALWLRRQRPDVVQGFLFHAYVLTAFVARMVRVPVVVAGRRSLGNFKEGRRLLLATERLATRLTDLLIANSQAVAADVVRQEDVAAAKVCVIPNGIPERFFEDQPPLEFDADTQVRITCVANLRVYKGHRTLLEAVAQLSDSGRQTTVLLAGEGPERSSLENQAAEAGIDVRFLGSVRDIPGLLAASDIVVLPSYEEGFSNSLLEAMAAGRPIIATSVGGNPEALGDGGLLVPPRDASALRDALDRLLAHPETARELGARARARAHAEYSESAMVAHYISVYEKLCGSAGRRISPCVA